METGLQMEGRDGSLCQTSSQPYTVVAIQDCKVFCKEYGLQRFSKRFTKGRHLQY